MTLFGSSFALLHLLLLLSLCYLSSVIANNNETDRLALLEFKSGVYDPFGAMASWNNSIHFCHWNGVTCGLRHQRVTILELSSSRLAGSISPHIGNLSFLRNLILENNSFTGQIPRELGRLHKLQILSLANNSLVEGIPSNLSSCLSLVNINLSRNLLSGIIPLEIGFLMKLKVLYLDHNDLTGNIPSSLGNLSSLQKLHIASNRLGGGIPYSLGQLTDLTLLVLADNIFEGTIPTSVFNLSNMEIFGVYRNRLHGNLPLELGILFPNLQYLGIHDNLFTGFIPPSISNASNLQQLYVNENKLSGQVPDLDNLHNLEWLNIRVNMLGSGREGDLRFLSTLINATSLRSISISYNNFGGVLPDSLANLSSTTLLRLFISTNQIGGRLPAGVGNLKSLEAFSADQNQLSGSIPEDIGKLQSLRYLELSENEFIGNIPASVGNLRNLISLVLDGNKLQGSIPSSLGNCQSLLQFTIADNNISGTILSTLFTISSLLVGLDLSGNKLSGSISNIGNLNNLVRLDVSSNLLTGVIPTSLGSCESLEFIGMDENFFHGTIPSSFASLRGLQYLNLSHNNLSGEVPGFLESIPFQSLDLSFNNFSGSLTNGGIFKNASVVSVQGNSMLCGGTSNLRLPTCTSGDRKKKGMIWRLKIIIGIVLSSLVAFLVFISLIFWLSKKKNTKRYVPSSSTNALWHVSYQTLYRSTEGFSSTHLIGTGGFGSVYKGILSDPYKVVAVKVFHLQQKGASRSFIVECNALRNIRHRNLLKVITACSSIDSHGDDFKAIVYEFMANGNLDQRLHLATRKLSLLQKLSIAIDIAYALDYLHHQYGRAPIIHCDLKPTNILLNKEMTAQVGDFGLMKFLSQSTSDIPISQTSTTGLRGTIGYAAPEYGTGSEVSTYGDMYSYGILLLEMFTTRRPTDDMFNNDMNLRNYVKMAVPDQVAGVADPILVLEARDNVGGTDSYQKIMEALVLIFGVGIACSEDAPRERMDASDALAELILIRDKHVIPWRRVHAT